MQQLTNRYVAIWGRSTGRWVPLALSAGWAKAELDTLMRVIYRESRGDPRATNGQYRGLLQLAHCWWAGHDPYDPAVNLRLGLHVRRTCGWRAWSTY